mmetsp:Transcript_25977/g.39891  ORF Transcript_25977/g.39891 Transcript_25977/m.39891 type:complete len:589 (+) Transcript_25977:221-1987(+)|eukprot:CAMPEP_0195294968 /NCGR_PEP_ID=MMETSP0707-20130614/16295_1 /TAXON_ID=33640 /ORGANISM="Asterionellopsis glacialis, Strain CCMP134" /LENGTH=588 /DNA_ID=CAMNT_0040356071 /DNA_START=173 /DNA_END=1939 /DNA_ORIENTATION=+
MSSSNQYAGGDDNNPTIDTPLAMTYVAGEDKGRLRSVAAYFGIEERMPKGFRSLMNDSTLASARMHSVGILGGEERVGADGHVHELTITKRKLGTTIPNYGDLMDLFHHDPVELRAKPVEADEYEEIILDTVEGGSLTAAVFGIIKGTVGPAILYLPRGFQISGYAVAIPSMILAMTSYLYSANRLLECWREESIKIQKGAERLEEIQALLLGDPKTGKPYYGSTTSASSSSTRAPLEIHADLEDQLSPKLLTYPELARRALGGWAFFVTFGIASMQFGVCLTYLIFVPQNLHESTRVLFGLDVDQRWFLVGMLLVEIPLCWIRDIRKLTPTNILATFLIAYGLASVLGIALYQTWSQDGSLVTNVANLPAWNDTWYLFVGTSFFVFEGSITLLVPLQEAVYSREDKEKFPFANNVTTICIVIFYIIFAITCWSSFGDGMKTALTASLPEGSLSTNVQFAYSLAVILTFPLQAFPALEVTFDFHGNQVGHEDKSTIHKRNFASASIVLLLGFIAVVSIDYLGNVVSILGSFIGIPIALIFPPIMHNKLVSNISKCTRIMNIGVAFLGFLATIAASYTTIVSWDQGAEG